MRARGQTLVLMSLTMLFVVLMVCMTIGIAYRAKEKSDLQALADAAAFTNATMTARMYNTASVLNRTMVSHYAAMAAVQADIAWVSMGGAVTGAAAGLARMHEAPNPGFAQANGCAYDFYPGKTLAKDEVPDWYACPQYYEPGGAGGCTQRTVEVRSASSTFWHGGLSYERPKNGAITDNVAMGCHDGVRPCHGKEDRIAIGIATLELDAADQVRELHAAINDLAKVQKKVWARMEDNVKGGRTTRRLVAISQGKKQTATSDPSPESLRPFVVHGEETAWAELDAATSDGKDRKQNDANDTVDPFRQMLGEAVMGTRVERHTIQFNDDKLPPIAKKYWDRANAHMNDHFPGVWDFKLTSGLDVRGVLSETRDDRRTMKEGDEMGKFMPGSRLVVGEAEITLSVTYRNPCDGRKPRTIPARIRMEVSSGWNFDYHNGLHDGPEEVVQAHRVGNFGNDCNNHKHYDEETSDIHKLEESLYPDEALGFVFPVNKGPNRQKEPGAIGAWGVPKMPVLLAKLDDEKKPLPWELDFKFRMRKGSKGTSLDLNGGSDKGMPKLSAVANGIAYYHRRTAIGEPPNMLNPFWRATLVPGEIDSRDPGGGDRTPLLDFRKFEEKELPKMLNEQVKDPVSASVYNKLSAKNFKGVK